MEQIYSRMATQTDAPPMEAPHLPDTDEEADVHETTNDVDSDSSPREEPGLKWEMVSCLPFPHFTLILNLMVPPLYIEDLEIQEELRGFKDRVESELSSDMFDVFVTGAQFQGLCLPPVVHTPMEREWANKAEDGGTGSEALKADVDIIYKLKTKAVGYKSDVESSPQDIGRLDFVIEAQNFHSGFTHLLVTGTDKVYLSAAAIVKEHNDMMRENENYARKNIGGKSINIGHINSILALQCSSWPKDAERWTTRERKSGWPGQALIDDIVSKGFLLVPKICKDGLYDTEWEFCFAEAELMLCKTLNTTQKQCYMLLRIVQAQVLDPPKILTAYHMKTVFFWILEHIPEERWYPENLVSCFVACLDTLFKFMARGEIPHYFIPQWNLLDGVADDFTFHLMFKVTQVRRDPLKYLLWFDRSHRFPFSPMVGWDVILKPILDDIEQRDTIILQNKFESSKMAAYSQLITHHIDQKNYKWATKHAGEESSHWHNLGIERSSLSCLNSHALQLGLERSVDFFEYLTKKPDDNSSDMSVTFGNLACLCFRQMCHSPDAIEKKTWKTKAGVNFERALTLSNQSSATKMDYANFLYRCEHTEKYLPLLHDIIASEKDSPQDCNGYEMDDIETLDGNLQDEVRSSVGTCITIPSVVHAYYLLIIHNINGDGQTDITGFVEEFRSLCDSIATKTVFSEVVQSLCFSMLGYIYMMTEKYDRAMEAFQKAAEKDPDSIIAVENMAKAMSLQEG